MGTCGSTERKNIIIYENERNLCIEKIKEIPNRTDINLQLLKDKIKEITKMNSSKEKALIIFYWICNNINYDPKSEDVSSEKVFKNGKAKCSGFAHLFQDISLFLGLEVECVKGFSKGLGYEPGVLFNKVNHEYNFIKLNEEWYPVDTTWGTGYFKGKDFIKSYNEFYFLTDPEILIKTHFPEEEKWQLTKRTYSLKKFLKWPQISNNFYKYGFNKFSPEEGYLELSKNKQTFIVYGENMEKKIGNCLIFLLEGNNYNQYTNLNMINYYENRFEIDCIFNKKGKYKVEIYANDDGTKTTNSIIKYILNIEKDARNEFYYPLYYKESKNIKIIEPIYDNLKSGEKVKFKIKSNLEKLVIIDNNEWHNMEKNKRGFFEIEIQIKASPKDHLLICKKTGRSSCEDLISYTIN